MKQQKAFTLTYPLTHKVVRDLKIVTEKVADLRVEGVRYPSGDYDVEYVWYDITDIKPVLEAIGYLEDICDWLDIQLCKKAGV